MGRWVVLGRLVTSHTDRIHAGQSHQRPRAISTISAPIRCAVTAHQSPARHPRTATVGGVQRQSVSALPVQDNSWGRQEASVGAVPALGPSSPSASGRDSARSNISCSCRRRTLWSARAGHWRGDVARTPLPGRSCERHIRDQPS